MIDPGKNYDEDIKNDDDKRTGGRNSHNRGTHAVRGGDGGQFEAQGLLVCGHAFVRFHRLRC